MTMKIFKKTIFYSFAVMAMSLLASCEDTKSYSELLTEEEHAVNWYLAQNTVALEVPENGDFETGPTAPYYKMDKDGYVYMQVISKGDIATEEERPQKGDQVYFRFMRMNLKSLMETGNEYWEGNSEDMGAGTGSSSLIYGNNVLTSTTQYGEGIQVPLEYLGYNSEVNLIVKSPEGFTTDVSECIPYKYNIRYFKAIY